MPSLAPIDDQDGDGVPDIVLGGDGPWSPSIPHEIRYRMPGTVRIISGRDGSELRSITDVGHEWREAPPIASLGGRGHLDFLVGIVEPSRFEFQLRSGGDGSKLRETRLSEQPAAGYARAVVPVGDLDLDGSPDVALWVAPPEDRGDHHAGDGVRLVVVAVDGEPLREYFPLASPGPRSVAKAGDVDADGVEDLLVGSHWGGLEVFSGRAGRRLHLLRTNMPEYRSFGDTMAACTMGDLDGDGHADFAYSICQRNSPGLPGHVRVHSGKTGRLLWQHTLESAREQE
jgi:hypothetical protein